eukprot:jgi/Mesvir1/16977/Mv15822-RA.1
MAALVSGAACQCAAFAPVFVTSQTAVNALDTVPSQRHGVKMGSSSSAFLKRMSMKASPLLTSSSAPMPRHVSIVSRAASGASEATSEASETIPPPSFPLASDVGMDYQPLADLMAAGKWEAADEFTRMALCKLASPEAAKRKWVYFTEMQFVPATDLQTIDKLWLHYSKEKFGFSVQKSIWIRNKKRWGDFFFALGWTYGENRTYRKFPEDYLWDLKKAPKGHLPLTNALRGTQLLTAVLTHPAFEKTGTKADLLK